MVQEALGTFQELNQLEVYVAGNSTEINDVQQREYELQSRQFVEELLPKYGFRKEQVYIRCSPERCCANLALNVDTGRTLLEVVDENDFLTIIYRGV